MADISAIQLPDGNTYNIKDDSSGYITGMTILSYGSSTWQDFLDAYNAHKVVYCRASSNSNPASGSQTRLAFMAYVNNATTPTEVEFQYYRSVSTHTASQQGDQVYVYKLDKTAGWTVIVREASVKVVAGTGLGGTYSNGTMTLTGPTISLNGSSTTSASFYAPTDAGTNGYVLKSNGSGAPTWAAAPSGTDEKLAVSEVSTNGTYYPIFGTGTAAATRQYDTTGFSYYEYNGTTSVTGTSRIILGNNTPARTAGNKIGSIQIYGETAYSYTIAASALGPLANRTLTLPDKTGTIALTSDIPTIPSNNVTGSGSNNCLAIWSGTNTLSSTFLSTSSSYNNNSGVGTVNLYMGGTGQIYYKGQLVFYNGNSSNTITITPSNLTGFRTLTLPDKTGTIALTSDVPSISLNGSSTTSASFYAPTTAGTSGQVLTSNGSGAPTWSAISDEIFIAEYNSTTYADILAAYNAGKTIILKEVYSSATTYYAYLEKYTDNTFYFATPIDENNNNKAIYTYTIGSSISSDGSVYLDIPSISLNGISTTSASFYAPTTAGTSGQVLTSNGSGAPTWASIPAGVTVTLNGSTTTTPSFYAPTTAGTSGQVLTSSGSGAPTWQAAQSGSSVQIIRWT